MLNKIHMCYIYSNGQHIRKFAFVSLKLAESIYEPLAKISRKLWMEEEYGRSYVTPIIKMEEGAPRELQIIQSKFY